MNVAERLKYWRQFKNISVYKLSQDSGISENHIRNLEKGLKQPTIVTLEQLADSLNITLSEFFNMDNNNLVYPTEHEMELLNCYRALPKEKADSLVEFCKIMSK